MSSSKIHDFPRRSVFLGSLGLGVLALTGCGTTLTQLAQDAQLIENALPTVLSSVAPGVSVPGSLLTAVNTAITAATQIANGTGTTTSLVQTLLKTLPAIATLITPLGLPTVAVQVVDAAISLAPELASLAGLAGAETAKNGKYDVATAKAILAKAVAAKSIQVN